MKMNANMRTRLRIVAGRRGYAMLIGLLAMMLTVSLGLAFVCITSSSLSASRQGLARTQALTAAEAGIDQAIAFLRGPAPNGTTDGSWRTFHPSVNGDDHSNDTWYSSSLSDYQSYKICVRNGTGLLSGKIVITSVGTASQGGVTKTRTIKAVVELHEENVNVWNNVIFGGVGQAGKSINGNVMMRGSVHLLGDGEDFTDVDGDGRWDSGETFTDSNHNGVYDLGEPYSDADADGHYDARETFVDVNGNGVRDPALTVTDMASEVNGNANVGNNYEGMSASLLSKIPTPPQKPFNGETVESLSAKLRVKHGKVNVSGSATVGDPNAAGGAPPRKETMDGCYVSDGYGGNAGASSVHSDNGSSATYDLPDGTVTFPALTDPYTDAGGVQYSSYMSYLQANGTVVAGDLNLTPGTAQTISGPKGSLSIDASGQMTISGIVYVQGNINFNRGSGSTITYSGKGTLVSTGSTYIHTNLLPAVNFPRTDSLGLIARQNMELATGSGDSQLTLAGAFYAQWSVISKKQSEIAGTLVGSYFAMQNVPHLFQVPELASNLPPGMPGADPIWIVSVDVVSWQEK